MVGYAIDDSRQEGQDDRRQQGRSRQSPIGVAVK